MRIQTIASSNVQNIIKMNLSKKLSQKKPILISASGLAAALTAKSFLEKTKNDSLELSGHWETHEPMDSSDYYYQYWVEDKPQQYIPGSGDPDYGNTDDSSN